MGFCFVAQFEGLGCTHRIYEVSRRSRTNSRESSYEKMRSVICRSCFLVRFPFLPLHIVWSTDLGKELVTSPWSFMSHSSDIFFFLSYYRAFASVTEFFISLSYMAGMYVCIYMYTVYFSPPNPVCQFIFHFIFQAKKIYLQYLWPSTGSLPICWHIPSLSLSLSQNT